MDLQLLKDQVDVFAIINTNKNSKYSKQINLPHYKLTVDVEHNLIVVVQYYPNNFVILYMYTEMNKQIDKHHLPDQNKM